MEPTQFLSRSAFHRDTRQHSQLRLGRHNIAAPPQTHRRSFLLFRSHWLHQHHNRQTLVRTHMFRPYTMRSRRNSAHRMPLLQNHPLNRCIPLPAKETRKISKAPKAKIDLNGSSQSVSPKYAGRHAHIQNCRSCNLSSQLQLQC